MAQSKWIVSVVEEDKDEDEAERTKKKKEEQVPQLRTQVGQKPLPLRRLDTLMKRVREKITEGEEIMIRLQSGEDFSKLDELIVDKLTMAVDRFTTELREVSRDERYEGNEDMEGYDSTLMQAEDLLVGLKKALKDKGKKEDIHATRFQTNISSRLPKIDMPSFDGNKLKWFEFWGRFKSMIGGRNDMNEVDKLTYLIGALEGEAKTAIEGLDITDSNYEIAVGILTELFGKPDVVIDTHYEALEKIAPARSDTSDCRKTLNEIERHLKVLKNMGEDVDNNNQLRHMLKNKFPARIQYNLSISMKNRENTVGNIRDSLKEIISAEEMSSPSVHGSSQSSAEKKAFTTETLAAVGSAQKRGHTDSQSHTHKRPRSRSTEPRHSTTRSANANRPVTHGEHRRPNQTSKASYQGKRRHSSTQLYSQGRASGPPAKSSEPRPKSSRLECYFCQGNHFADTCESYRTTQTRKERMKGRCFICFAPNHSCSRCPMARKKCFFCQKTGHHRSLCLSKFSQEKKEDKVTTLTVQSSYDTILQTAVTTVLDETLNRGMQARILFDTGSQKSYITTAIMKKLCLNPIETNCLTIYTFGYPKPKIVDSEMVYIQIKTGQGEQIGIHVYVVPTITGLIPSFEHTKSQLRLAYPQIAMADDTKEDSHADVLIGNDNYHSFFTGQLKQIEDHLYLIESKLGWIASGRPTQDEKDVLSVLTYVQGGPHDRNTRLHTMPDPPLLDDNIKVIWELEAIGVTDPPKVFEQDEIIKHFNQTTEFRENRYLVKWPWIQYPSDLPINYGMAYGRLQSLIKRIDPSVLQQYDSVLKDQLQKGIVEIVKETVLPKTHAVHYLPHHCVIQDSKTTKLRIVYDASAKSKSHCSLNEYLYKGPSMLEDLVSLLLNFRSHPVGIVADVEKAFLQVGLQEDDRDVTRFLWLKDLKRGVSEENLVHLRFCRVPFGVISSPFLLAATIQFHLNKEQSKEADEIRRSLYVDNLVTGADSPETGYKLCSTAITRFSELSMRIRDWTSNSQELLDLIPPDLRNAQPAKTKVLGLTWDTIEDSLKLAVDPEVLVKDVSSKREVLRVIASVFDPCGLVSPLILPARLFLQQLWVKQYKWDTCLDATQVAKWKQCVRTLQFIPEAIIPRYYFGNTHEYKLKPTPREEEFHCFTDASQDAYSAVIYLRTVTQLPTVSIVMSRTRLKPVKLIESMTTPKMELLGVLIGARLLNYVQKTLGKPAAQCFLWTDSKIVLDWMKSRKLLEPFVSRRVSEIRSYQSIQHRYVSSKDNPADLATRIQTAPLPPFWWEGPQFLQLSTSEWPPAIPAIHSCPQTGGSVEASETSGGTRLSHKSLHERPEAGHNDMTDDNFSDEDQLIGSRERDHNYTDANSVTGEHELGEPDHTSTTDHMMTENSLSETIRILQQQKFPKEVAGSATAFSKSLGLFMDSQGLLRCEGRLQNALMPYDQKFPILLPRDEPFTLNTIKKLHEDNHHVGTRQTLALLRKKYWIPSGRSQTAKVLRTCPQCIKYGGGPYKLPPMPPLPPERVQFCRPFIYSGLDYLGPLTVVEDNVTKKRWCCIFTCMASRAVRLEVVKSLSAEEFLLCLRRFVATQGVPALIVSDNAAQFKLTADVIQSPLCKDNNIAWHFIPELAPWHGGFYERLVGLIKHCLRRTLDKNLLSDNQLLTIFREIETILNSRPLTYVGADLDHVLTPADFLSTCGTHPLTLEDTSIPQQITATKSDLIEGWKRGQHVLDEFKSMFQGEYLTSLRERAQVPHRQPRVKVASQPQMGDVVQIWDDKSKTTNRAHWKVGKIVALAPSRDGNIRTAKVQLDSGLVLTRSISHLYPLEFSPAPERQENLEGGDTNSSSDPLSQQPPLRQVDSSGSGGEQNSDVAHVTTQPPQSSATEAADTEDEPTGTAVSTDDSSHTTASLSPRQHAEDTIDSPQQASPRPRRNAFDAARHVIRRWTDILSAFAGVSSNSH